MTSPIDANPTGGDQVLLCRLSGPNAGQLRAFLETSGGESACRPVARRTADGFETVAVLTGDQLEVARARRSADQVQIEVLEDLTSQESARQSQVGDANRFAARGSVPRGLGRKE